ncbi:MAG: ZIP family metal transporter [Nitrospirota bacterium]|nr:MAG: ZIP family metal transporter [Nitrospirota bacterium]
MIVFAALLAYISAFLGGYLNLRGTGLSPEKVNISNGFSAGLLISIAIVHILPEAQIDKNYIYVLLGLGIFYIIQGYIRTNYCGDEGCETHEATGMLAWTGISFHALVDGIAMGVSFKASGSLGILVMMAILIHKAPMGFSVSSILLSRGYSSNRVKGMLAIFSAVTPLGALMSYLLLGATSETFLAIALAFSGGTFLHIYTSELLPDVHGPKDRKVVIFVILGIVTGILPKLIAPVV